MSAHEAENLLREAGWTQAMDYDGATPVVLIAKQGHLYAITGVDPYGENRSGARADPISLALDLIAMARRPEPVAAAPEPEPEPEPTPEPEPVAVAAVEPEPEPEPTLEPEPVEPSPDLAAEIEALKAKLAEAEEARIRAEAEIDRLLDEASHHKIEEDATPLPDLDEVMVPPSISALMEDGETLKQAKLRLYPLLQDELAELKNQEALFGKTIPRRAEVESLIGVLARVGEM